ncbi:MAG: TonB-dependent receptor [Massilia sp.]
MKQKLTMSFKLSAVALAVGQAFAPNAFAQVADTQTVTVTGIRASARSSVAIKRDTMEVVDSITAEDIGKLPDPNVVETLTRIPGVQGYRYGGEGASPVGAGSGLTIRGLSNLTASQMNNRAYFTAGSREFNIESAIPGMIAGVDVYKNPSAEHIEGGIGGLVNIRTRNPSDFKSLTVSLGVTERYNDLAKKKDPELFALVANKWDLGGGSKFGVMGAAVYQKSTGRSDNNPANGGANFKRAIRADTPEYATLAAANTTNDRTKPMAAYVGRTDVNFLSGVGALGTSATVGPNTPNLSGLTADQISNVMVAPALTSNVFEETIMRERKGLNLAADYRVDNTLRFYAEANYLYYLYHQNYRGMNSNDGGNVLGLTTTPFNFTEGLANRNINGGSDDVLVSKRLLGGTFLNSTLSNVGGDEHTAYTTKIGATGVDWVPMPGLTLKGDLSYIKSEKTTDNRSVNLESANGLLWSTTRLVDGAPHQLSFSGPSTSDPASFVFNKYNNGNNIHSDDSGYAAAFSGTYDVEGFFNKIRFGARLAHQDDKFRNYSFNNAPLTTDGLPLAANFSNAISANSMTNVVENAPGNFMGGDAGYAGGYVVYTPDALLGNQVMVAFPKAGILAQDFLLEQPLQRSSFGEKTKAMYLVGDFATFGDKLKGNVGVRVVRTETTATARVTDVSTPSTPKIIDVTKSSAYTNVLPTFNATYDLAKDTLLRFGYGRNMTRPDLGSLSPNANYNVSAGAAGLGNPDLKPQVADSFDLSLEHYFTKTNYVAGAVFDKEIKDFFNNILECQTISFLPAYAGALSNGCSNGQYAVTRKNNSEKGYARGVELSGQYFFDSQAGWMKNFGVSGSYTYVKTSNPINFGTAAVPNIVETIQPFVSKHNFSLSGMYEDSKLSARLVYTWRSEQVFNSVSANPIDARAINAYGILDGAANYELMPNVTLSLNGSNLTNKALNRYVGEPGTYLTNIERQHYANGRTFSVGLRYKFGG